MVYDGNRSIDGTAFTTQSGTGDNCDVGQGQPEQAPGAPDTGTEIPERQCRESRRGETCNSLNSKLVPESSDQTAANTRASF